MLIHMYNIHRITLECVCTVYIKVYLIHELYLFTNPGHYLHELYLFNNLHY